MRKHFSVGAATVALAVGLTLVAACAPPPPGPGTTPTTTTIVNPNTSITGRVVDSITGEPVPGASVAVTDLTGAYIRPVGEGSLSTGTDSDGYFGITDVPSTFTLRVSKLGFESGLVVCPPSFPYYLPCRLVEDVTSGAFVFSPGDAGVIKLDSFMPHTFTGLVRDAANQRPVVGAKVVLASPAGELSDTESTFTDSSGKFSLTAAVGVDDVSVYVDGSSVGYDSGYVGCVTFSNGDRKVIATFAEACTYPPVDLSLVGLAPL